MKQINVNNGLFALVDDEDYERINQFKWYSYLHRNTYYAARTIFIDGKKIKQRMHWDILGLKMIDHEDHNGLNNQKYNLRSCTNQQNCMNSGSSKKSTSLYKGVSWSNERKKWVSQIMLNRKQIPIGRFTDEIEAAKAYDLKAKELFGEFAYLNFK